MSPLNFGPAELRCLTALSRNGVEFLIIGGHAVRYHGYMRPAKDVDVLVGNDQANAVRLCVALAEILGVTHPNITPAQFVGRKRQVNLEEWGLNFEVLSAADGIEFPQAHAHRCLVTLGSIEVPIISKEDLIVMKRRAGRPQDLNDIAALQAG